MTNGRWLPAAKVRVAWDRVLMLTMPAFRRLMVPVLLTPGQAAQLLSVPESWLRRKAGLRLIPATYIGKHLRFSPADLAAIAHAGARPARQPGRAPRAPQRRRQPRQ